ncbi:hypothetical protein [Jiella mangrovi]|uniref:Fimbrial protein n=1 Tax=Jiella mangrovi TaxID=2821407 RepID=A0ABS4BEI4_9HYPH|nr:hypothetical protein [Jiella mangrovi]MBP0615161.1 hypothetical protein [Jiella mangrovi]
MGFGNQDAVEDDKPLDPAAERLRRKMVRLLVVSIGIMIIGVMAVLGVVVYKTLPKAGGLGEETATVVLAPGEEIVDTSLDGDRALIHTRANGADHLYVVAIADGRILKRLQIAPEAAGQ